MDFSQFDQTMEERYVANHKLNKIIGQLQMF